MKKKWYEIIIDMNGTLLSALIHILFIAFCNDLKEQLKDDYGAWLMSSLFVLSYLLWIIIINVSIHWIKKGKTTSLQ